MEYDYSRQKENIEQKTHQEVERKFLAASDTQLERCRPYADKITQLYISHPDDEYSLRLRQVSEYEGATRYTATLKDRGILTPSGLSRMEVEVPINETTFQHYAHQGGYPILHKERVHLCDTISIDWIEGHPHPIVEIEYKESNDKDAAEQFLCEFSNVLTERTGQLETDNEFIAHSLFEGNINRAEALSAEDIIENIVRYRARHSDRVTIGISGRSGSGKSTLARQIQEAIAHHHHLQERAAIVSTDDYNLGRQYLEDRYGRPWNNWEDARVYDTKQLARDIAAWQDDGIIAKRYFDFAAEAPVIGETLPESSILIIEGIHASSVDLAAYRQIHYEMPTPLSVSLGRDLTRLLSTDRLEAAMKSPEERLRYVLEIGEPTYQAIQRAI